MASKFGSQLDLFKHYSSRFNYYSEYKLDRDFHSEAQLCVVIPCYNEPELISTLQSLVVAKQPSQGIEIIIVLNAPEHAPEFIRHQNHKTKADFEEWITKKQSPKLRFHLLEAEQLPAKKAGVGLARKIGMDEAFRQFSLQNRIGHIICLDADCVVSSNYLVEAEQQLTPEIRGAHFQFEHDLETINDNGLKQGIVQYELHLRYHNQGLISTGFPYAHHTIGSCMVVRSDVYGLLGGMNQRKAGEDFYFMNKIYPGGDCITIRNARVYPSARVSDRVPFGTGRAQDNWLKSNGNQFETYDFKIYEIVQLLFQKAIQFNQFDLEEYPIQLHGFLKSLDFVNKRHHVLKRSRPKSFQKNFFQWFDAFQLLKAIHYLRDNGYPNIPLLNAVQGQLKDNGHQAKETNLESILLKYRQLESV